MPTPIRVEIDVTTLSGWASLEDGSHLVTVKSAASGYVDSYPSDPVTITKQSVVKSVLKLANGDTFTTKNNEDFVLRED